LRIKDIPFVKDILPYYSFHFSLPLSFGAKKEEYVL